MRSNTFSRHPARLRARPAPVRGDGHLTPSALLLRPLLRHFFCRQLNDDTGMNDHASDDDDDGADDDGADFAACNRNGRGAPRNSVKRQSQGSRYECSLYFLTKKFVGLIQVAEDGILDLNSAAVDLHVKVPISPPAASPVIRPCHAPLPLRIAAARRWLWLMLLPLDPPPPTSAPSRSEGSTTSPTCLRVSG